MVLSAFTSTLMMVGIVFFSDRKKVFWSKSSFYKKLNRVIYSPYCGYSNGDSFWRDLLNKLNILKY